MEKLLKKHAEEIFKMLREKLAGRKTGTIWQNKDFRIDAGATLNGHPEVKTWNLQANNGAQRNGGVDLGRRGTHERLFWDTFDTKEPPPNFQVWAEEVLEWFV